MSRLLTHWNSIPGKPGFKTIGGQSIFGSGDIAVSDSSKVPYTGATQGLNMGLYDIQATRFQFGSTGPRLDAAVDGTVRVRTNDGLADAPLSASNLTLSGNQIIGNPSGLGPSPYLSAVNSFSEATLELRNALTNAYTKLNLGSLVASGNITANNFIGALDASYLSGTVPDARLSSNVPLKDAANTFTANQTIDFGSGVDLRTDSANWAVGHRISGAFQTQFGIYQLKMHSGYQLQWSNNGSNISTIDTRIVRNATGPTFETRAAGGLRVCNADGSALANVTCSGVNVFNGANRTGILFDGGSGTRLLVSSGGWFGIGSSGTDANTQDVSLSRASAGVWQMGTTANNALGSLNLANLTASGAITVGTTFGTAPLIVSCGVYGNLRFGSAASPTRAYLQTTSGSTGLEITTAGSAPLYLQYGLGRVLVGTVTDDGVNRLQVSGGIAASGTVTSAFRSISADPTTLDVGSGLSQLVKNTTSGEIRLWVNDGGTMKKSAALT